MAVVALAACASLSACTAAGSSSDPDSAEAQALAQQLNERLAMVGLPPIDPATAAVLYGTDGGVSCENVGELQQRLALSQFGNNSIHLRRVVMDPSVLLYDVAVIATYCPDRAEKLLDEVGDLGTEVTIPTR